jgi:hypothetical protein
MNLWYMIYWIMQGGFIAKEYESIDVKLID